jgi:valyl-tRNA synthetase
MNTEELDQGEADLSAADRWILARFDKTIETVHRNFDAYRLDLVAHAIYEFTWHEFCDWYLELSKPVLQSEDASDEARRGTRQTLINVLEGLLRLLHPIMPFVTEEVWQQVAPRAGIDAATIMLQPYPQPASAPQDETAVADIEWLKQFILGVRQIRGEMDISPGKSLPVIMQSASAEDERRAAQHASLLQRVGRVESVTMLAVDEEPPPSATALLDDVRLLVPMKGIIDVEAERQRLEKQRDKIDAELKRARGKLGNPKFVNNAPADVVAQERQRESEFERQIDQLSEQLARLSEFA